MVHINYHLALRLCGLSELIAIDALFLRPRERFFEFLRARRKSTQSTRGPSQDVLHSLVGRFLYFSRIARNVTLRAETRCTRRRFRNNNKISVRVPTRPSHRFQIDFFVLLPFFWTRNKSTILVANVCTTLIESQWTCITYCFVPVKLDA